MNRPATSLRSTCCVFVALGMLALTAFGSIHAVHADTVDRLLEERVKLRRNAPRGMEYVPTSSASGQEGAARPVEVMPVIKINLDGDAIDNNYSNLLPIDFNGNGTSEYLHFNGHRVMRVYGRAGNKIWQIDNTAGRKLASGYYMHRDQAAVLDLDGDGRDDVLHCWQSGSLKYLIARKGTNGKEIRKVALPGQSVTRGAQCRIAVYYKQSDKKPIILLGGTQPTSGACGGRNYTDNWAQVDAFDLNLNKLWTTNTCDAGHVTAGVDADFDGYFEYVFVGKFALDFNGKIRCTLQGWKSTDHVDAIRIVRLDPASSTIQAVAMGASAGGAFNPADCTRIWAVPVYNPQVVAVGQFDPAPAPLSMTVTNRAGTSPTVEMTVIDANGQKVRTVAMEILPMQNAQLDGYRRDDELLAMFGEVFNDQGDMLLSRDWYWNLKGSIVQEKPITTEYDQWAGCPLLFDMDNDGAEELVVWGQSLIVEGKFQR